MQRLLPLASNFVLQRNVSRVGGVAAIQPMRRCTTAAATVVPNGITKLWTQTQAFITYFNESSMLLTRQVSLAMHLKRERGHRDLNQREEFHLVRFGRDLPKSVLFAALFPFPGAFIVYGAVFKLFPALLPSAFHTMTKEKYPLAPVSVLVGLQRAISNAVGWIREKNYIHKVLHMAEDNVIQRAATLSDSFLLEFLSQQERLALAVKLDCGCDHDSLVRAFKMLRYDNELLQQVGAGSLTVPELKAALQVRGWTDMKVGELEPSSEVVSRIVIAHTVQHMQDPAVQDQLRVLRCYLGLAVDQKVSPVLLMMTASQLGVRPI